MPKQVYVSEEVQKLDHLRNMLLIPHYFGLDESAFIAVSSKFVKTFLGCATGANVLTALKNLSYVPSSLFGSNAYMRGT